MRSLSLSSRVLILLAFSITVYAFEQYSFSARGRTYTVTTTRLSGSGFSFPNHWMYQPSVVLPSALTGNQYVMLFASNRVAGQNLGSGVAIFMTTSSNGYSGWSTPIILIDSTSADNICDIAGARPVWNGSQWFIYTQALTGTFSSGSCTGTSNVVLMATGPALTSGLVQWVKDVGTNNARVVLSGTGVGIGEDQQWFNTGPYGGPLTDPLKVTYNDWGFTGMYGGVALFSGLFAPNMSTGGFWSGPTWSPNNGGPWFETIYYFPDAMLINTLDESTYGPPAIAFQSTCQLTDRRYQYAVGLSYFPNPHSSTPINGTAYPGPLEGTSSDTNGPRMFRPRVARNEHGYIPTTAPGSSGSLRIWKTYLYYNDKQINVNSTDPCNSYSRWNTSDQRFSVSELTIMEQ